MADITLGQIAGLLVAIAFAILVYYSIKPLRKLSKVLDELAGSLKELTEHTLPAIDEAAKTVAEANSQVRKLDVITDAAARTTQDISAMTTLVTSTVGAPFVAVRKGAHKVKSFFAPDDPTVGRAASAATDSATDSAASSAADASSAPDSADYTI